MTKSKDMDNWLNIKRLENKIEIAKDVVKYIDRYARDTDLTQEINVTALRDQLSELEMFLMSK